MNDPLYEYFFSFRTLEGLSSCHRPILEPHLLWYAAADNAMQRRQELFEMKAVREGVAQSVFEELPDLLPPESSVEPVFKFIQESRDTPIASKFHGSESILATQTGYVVGQLDSRRIGESKTNRTSTLTSLTNQTLVQQDNQYHQLQADTPRPRHQTCASYQMVTKYLTPNDLPS